MKRAMACAWMALLVLPYVSRAAVLAPLATFGGGDGWLAPGEGGYTFLGTANNERGLAYGNGHVYLVSRTGGDHVRILDPLTGGDLGGVYLTRISGRTIADDIAGRSAEG